jgi:hypothetical protein
LHNTLIHVFACIQGFFVKGKGGRPDALRAANKLLRDALNGRSGAIISFYPPYSSSTTVDAKELPADTPFLYCVDEINTPTTAAQEEQYEQKVHSRKAREGTLTNREMRQAQAERDAITAVNDTNTSTTNVHTTSSVRAGSYIDNESSDSDDNDSDTNDDTAQQQQQQQQQQSGAFAALDSSSDDTDSGDGISD